MSRKITLNKHNRDFLYLYLKSFHKVTSQTEIVLQKLKEALQATMRNIYEQYKNEKNRNLTVLQHLTLKRCVTNLFQKEINNFELFLKTIKTDSKCTKFMRKVIRVITKRIDLAINDKKTDEISSYDIWLYNLIQKTQGQKYEAVDEINNTKLKIIHTLETQNILDSFIYTIGEILLNKFMKDKGLLFANICYFSSALSWDIT